MFTLPLFPAIIFLLLGTVAIIVPFIAENFKSVSITQKIIAFGLFLSIGGVFAYVGGKSIYDYLFESYPGISVKGYVESTFNEHNTIKSSNGEPEVIEIENESAVDYCGETDCSRDSEIWLFRGADVDTNKIVTYEELYQLIKSFDINNDDTLNSKLPKIKTIFTDEKPSELQNLHSTYRTVYGKRIAKENFHKN